MTIRTLRLSRNRGSSSHWRNVWLQFANVVLQLLAITLRSSGAPRSVHHPIRQSDGAQHSAEWPLLGSFVRFDDLLHQMMPNDVLASKKMKPDLRQRAQDPGDFDEPGLPTARQVNLRHITCDDHF